MTDDAELITIEAFIIAVRQNRGSLPEGVSDQITDIARSQDTRAIDLHEFAMNTPELATSYREAARHLNSQAAERGMGLERAMKYGRQIDPQSSGSSTEGENVTPDIQPLIERFFKKESKKPDHEKG